MKRRNYLVKGIVYLKQKIRVLYTNNLVSYLICVARTKRLLKSQKIAFVLGAPFHSNMGDQAQTYCTQIWMEKNYPEYYCWAINGRYLRLYDFKLLKLIRHLIKEKDMIFLHSGYHTTDLYMWEETIQRKTIELFSDRRIVILPQTVNYVDKTQENISKEIYNKHKNLVLITRDDVSYKKALDIFPNLKVYEYPDIVTSLIGTRKYSSERAGIMLCLRNDKESIFDQQRLNEFENEIKHITNKVSITDTTLNIGALYASKNREIILEKIWSEYSKFKLVITDRYHGTIFSLIAGTPVIILPSADHKLCSIINWFPEEYSEYVQYVSDINEVINVAREMLNKQFAFYLPEYFNYTYYDKLKDEIEGAESGTV